MSKLLPREQSPSLKLIKVIEDGSAKTFIYENPHQTDRSGFMDRLRAKIQRRLKTLAN